MKIKYSFVISFCLMLFLFFSFLTPVHAEVVFSLDSDISLCLDEVNLKDSISNYSNVLICVRSYPLSDSLSNNYYILCSNASIPVTSSSTSYGTRYDFKLVTGYDCRVNHDTFIATISSTFKNSTFFYSGDTSKVSFYNYKGVATLNNVPVSDTFKGSSLSKDDILNFNWSGNGLKIYNLEKDMKVSGYANKQTGLKWFDIEVYGKFTSSESSWFSSFAKKNMQTKIQNNTYATIGGETRHMGEGLGVKSFEWVNSDSVAVGSELKFRMVVTAPMLLTGSADVKIGTTIPDGSQYISDSVESINFLSSNADSYGEKPVEGGSSAYVDNSTPGNSSTYGNDDSASGGIISIFTSIGNSIINFFKMILDVLTSVGSIAPQLATAFSALFMFLPSPIPQLITASFAIVIFVAVLHFLRG